MDKEFFGKQMVEFLAIFKNYKADDSTLEIYYQRLKEISESDFQQGINSIINNVTSIYPDTNFVSLVRDQLREDMKDTVMTAWEKAFKAIGLVGAYNSVKFDDPAIHSTIDLMGGWVLFCAMTDDEIKWKQKEFADIYRGMHKKSSHSMLLQGKVEQNNSAKGYEFEEPVSVGNEKNRVKLLKYST